MFPSRFLSVPVLAAALALAGCEPKPREVTKAMQAEAALLVSEGEFANQLRDYQRAEPLFAKAVEIMPDAGETWVLLGAARRRLGDIKGARTAYREAVAAFERLRKQEPAQSDLIVQQVYAHALLGEIDRARALLEKAAKDYPSDRQIQGFIRSKVLDQMLADPTFKEVAL